jgi:hypothetical protein
MQEVSDAVFYYDGAIRLRDYLSENATSMGQRDTAANLASLGVLSRRIGSEQYEQLAKSAEARVRDLFEQLEIRDVSNLLSRRDLVSATAIFPAGVKGR